jgi:hypothetical protein
MRINGESMVAIIVMSICAAIGCMSSCNARRVEAIGRAYQVCYQHHSAKECKPGIP